MSKSNSKSLPFFSLLDDPTTHFKAYTPNFLQKLNKMIAKKAHDFAWSKIIARYVVALGCFIPAICALSFIATGGWLLSIAASALGFYALVKGWDHFQHYLACEKKAGFEEQVNDLVPPNEPHPEFKTRTKTFNQLYSFMVDDSKVIWYALRESRYKAPDWHPLFLEDYTMSNTKAIDLQADGQNFMARVSTDVDTQAFYKKVMHDSRDDHGYHIEDCLEAPQSVNHWFSLPVISLLKPATWGQRLKLNDMTRWLMTNDGSLRHNKQDKTGEWHTIWNCTTVYMQEGHTLILYDPYVTPGTEVRISLPQGVHVHNIQATSSRIFVFGERTVNGVTEDVLFERSIDYDVLGLNPIMPYTDYIHKVNERFLPLDKWKELALPKGMLTGNMTVIQTGCDKKAEIRLETNDEGGLGFYYKCLEDENWLRSKSQHVQELSFYPEIPFIPQQSFQAKNIHCFGKKYERVECDFFDDNIFDTRLKFYNQDKECLKLTLRRSANLVRSFIDGYTTQQWVLALTAAYQAKTDPCLFKNKHVMKVQVTHENGLLSIQGDDLSLQLNAKPLPSRPITFATSSQEHDTPVIERRHEHGKSSNMGNTI